MKNPPKKSPSEARARRKGGVGGIPPRPSRSEAPPPCSLRAEASKKVFFSFYLPAEARRDLSAVARSAKEEAPSEAANSIWWALRDLNPRPLLCRSSALTTAPSALKFSFPLNRHRRHFDNSF